MTRKAGSKKILKQKFFKRDAFHKVGGTKHNVSELCVLKEMRLHEDRGRDVERIADLGEITEKFGIAEFLLAFISYLFEDPALFHDFSPNTKHAFIIAQFLK